MAFLKQRSIACLIFIVFMPLLLSIPGGSAAAHQYRFTRQAGLLVETVLGWMAGNMVAKPFEAARETPATTAEALAYFDLAGRAGRLDRSVWGASTSGRDTTAAQTDEVSRMRWQMEALRPRVELLIQGQVATAITDAGLAARLGDGNLLFPPLIFRFQALPKLLVVSPRSRIERLSTVLLLPGISTEQAEALEASVSARGFSALVTQIGGLGIYPSMVPEGTGVRSTLQAVAHEWTHQFLAFKPLGWRYAFGAENDPRMITINETLAEIVGREMGDAVYAQEYAAALGRLPDPRQDDSLSPFRGLMRDVRTRVDSLLAEGKVAEAESYMEVARVELAGKGYYLRKLNQAYFAFHGSYADEPSFSGRDGQDIGRRMRAQRASSQSLAEFVSRVAAVGSYEELRQAAGQP